MLGQLEELVLEEQTENADYKDLVKSRIMEQIEAEIAQPGTQVTAPTGYDRQTFGSYGKA